jgi:integrase
VAICLFAGLRRSETLALTWEDIDLERCHIIVAGHKAKTRKRRLVTIQPNLAKWLKLGGDLPIKNRDNALTAAYRLIGPNWPANALRHSFVSYHLAMFNDVGKTALEAGNSPEMVFRH